MGSRRAPERTCVGCRRTSAKTDLLRFVSRGDSGAPEGASAGSREPASERAKERTRERTGGRIGVILDLTGTEPGRGAYVHRDAACVGRAFDRGALSRALRTGLTKDEVSRLRERVEGELDTA